MAESELLELKNEISEKENLIRSNPAPERGGIFEWPPKACSVHKKIEVHNYGGDSKD